MKIIVIGESCLKNKPFLDLIKEIRDEKKSISLCIIVNNPDNNTQTIKALNLTEKDYIQLPEPPAGKLREAWRKQLETKAEVLLFPASKKEVLLPLEVIRRRSGIKPEQIVVVSYNNDPADMKMLKSGKSLGFKTFPSPGLFITDNKPDIFTHLFLRSLQAPL